MADKVLVICLDGTTLDLLGPWMKEGRLPTLRSFQEEGVSGELCSVVPPITAPAWASFMTGKNPGKHGVYYFVNRGMHASQQAFVDASSRTGQTLWELLGEVGKRVMVLNVPTTYPPQPVNGVLISDFLTPPGRRDFTFPPELIDEIEARFGKYPLHLKTLLFSANLSARNAERLLRELHHELSYKFEVGHYLLDRHDSDFVILHILGTDRLQHELWNFLDPSHPRYQRRLGERFRGKILDYFGAVDTEIGRLVQRFDAETSIFIVSDHGFGPVHKGIDLNVWLLEEGYIQIKADPRSQRKYRLWKMGLTNEVLLKLMLQTLFRYGGGIVERLSEESILKSMRFFLRRGQKSPLFSLDDVDWSRTKAYCLVGMGGICVNLKGREPQGAVSPGWEYEMLKEEITAKLTNLTDPATGTRINGQVFKADEIYHGPFVDRAPDIIFLPNNAGYVAGNVLGFTSRRAIMNSAPWPGHHRMNGLFLAKGKYIRRGESIQDARIIDVAPTILYLLGSKIPSDVDGKVLTTIFDEDFLTRHQIEYAESSLSEDVPQLVASDDEEEVIRRLKDLGYLV